MLKFLVLLLALTTSVGFINYKFSKAIRIIAYNEAEEPNEAKVAMIVMAAAIFLWALYFSVFV